MSTPNDAPTPTPRRRFRLPLRDLLILILALVAGVGSGVLLLSAGVPAGQSVIGGCTAFGATLFFFDTIIE